MKLNLGRTFERFLKKKITKEFFKASKGQIKGRGALEPVGNQWQMHEQQKWISWINKATAVQGTIVEVVVVIK